MATKRSCILVLFGAIIVSLIPCDILVVAVSFGHFQHSSLERQSILSVNRVADTHEVATSTAADALDWSLIADTTFDDLMHFSQSALGGLNGTGNCMGLNKKMCKPCPSREYNDCKRVEEQCDKVCSSW